MIFTGFADEAAGDIAGQIRATKELGWSNIEVRLVDGQSIHEMPDDAFERVADSLDAAGVHANCLGSTIANWSQQITAPFEVTLEQVNRAIPRMKRLGARHVRIMSYACLAGHGPADQMREERFRRLSVIVKMFRDNGLVPLHENCSNYGGMGWTFTRELLENVPGLKLIFDTGNPVCNWDYSGGVPYVHQDSWEFWTHVRDAVEYIHIKDARWIPGREEVVFTWCGEGDANVQRILNDAFNRGFDGPVSIEPHLGNVFHDATKQSASADFKYRMYVEYGRRLEKMVAAAKGCSD